MKAKSFLWLEMSRMLLIPRSVFQRKLVLIANHAVYLQWDMLQNILDLLFKMFAKALYTGL